MKLPGGLLYRLNRRTGPRQRSAFIRRAIERELSRQNGQRKKRRRDADNIAPTEGDPARLLELCNIISANPKEINSADSPILEASPCARD